MFLDIARFELRYQLRNPVFWVVSVLFFLLTFGSITIEGVQIGGGSNVNANSPNNTIGMRNVLAGIVSAAVSFGSAS